MIVIMMISWRLLCFWVHSKHGWWLLVLFVLLFLSNQEGATGHKANSNATFQLWTSLPTSSRGVDTGKPRWGRLRSLNAWLGRVMWAIQGPGSEEFYKNDTATELGRVQSDESIAEGLEDKETKDSKTATRFLFLAWAWWRPEAESREALHSSSWPRLVAQCGQRKGERSRQPRRLDGQGNTVHPKKSLYQWPQTNLLNLCVGHWV